MNNNHNAMTINTCSNPGGHVFMENAPKGFRHCTICGLKQEHYVSMITGDSGWRNLEPIAISVHDCIHTFRLIHSHARVCDKCGLEQQLDEVSDTWKNSAHKQPKVSFTPEYVTSITEMGRKDDTGKAMAAIPYEEFPHALGGVIKVATFGARKYSRSNWTQVENKKQRYYDALHRHLLAHHAGEIHDAESNLPHLHHALWNFLAYVEIIETEKKEKTQ